MKRRVLWVASLGFATFSVFAQVEVVDRPVSSGSVGTAQPSYTEEPSVERPSANPAQASANNSAEMFYQFQVMQQELLELRGLVEQQTYEIKKLKQQRLDDYLDLDRRISSLSGLANTVPAVSSGRVAQPKVTTQSTAAVPNGPKTNTSPASEIAHYKSATKLVLMDRDYDAGIERLKEHLELYPTGRYKGNALYWLGEVYLAKSDLAQAKTWFEKLLSDYPQHAKVSDAKYKLGTTYHQLGDTEKAFSLLKEVSSSTGSAASLAEKYLNANY